MKKLTVRPMKSTYAPMKGQIVGVKINGFKKSKNVHLVLHWNGGISTQEIYEEIIRKLNA